MKSIPGQRKPIVMRSTWIEKAVPVVTATLLILLILIAGTAK